MAKQRYPKNLLGETIEDMKKNIEGAGANNTPEVKTETLNPDLVPVSSSKESPTPVTETKAEEPPVKSPTVLQADTPVKPIKEKKKPSAKAEDKKKVTNLDIPIIDDELIGRRNARNVELDDETLWRLDQVKDSLNRTRPEGVPLISQKAIMRTALIEWLDKYYPNTKEAYHFINNLD